VERATRDREFRHGEAVAYGMLVAAGIARTRGGLSETDHAALSGLIAQMGPLPAVTDLAIAQVLEAVGRDKKVIAGRLHYVLPGAIGTCEVVNDVTPDEIAASLRV